MASSGFNLGNSSPKFSGIRRSRVMNVGQGKNMALKGAGIIASSLKGIVYKSISLVMVFLLVMIAFVSCAFLAGDTDNGETGSYIDKSNSLAPSGSSQKEGIDYSVANSACKGFYDLLSKYTVLQEYKKDGKTIYIPLDDENAKSDYFKRDQNLIMDPNILYAMNEKVFSYEYVYPEAFLKPVAHTDSYILSSLVDDENRVIVKSKDHNREGKESGTSKTTADYGISALCTYKSLDIVTRLSGSYDRIVKINKETNAEEEEKLNTPIPFETIEINRQSEDVLDKSVSMNASITYNYNTVSTFANPCEKGVKSSNPADNVEMIKTGEETRVIEVPVTKDMYVVSHKTDSTKKTYQFDTLEQVNQFLNKHKNYDVSRDSSGKAVKVSVTVTEKKTEVWEVYSCRSADSGIYIDSFTIGENNVEEYDNQYLYDYLGHFTTYRPMVERTYETFRNMSTKASSVSYKSASQNGSDTGGGTSSSVEQFIASIVEAVQEDAKESGILPSITIAQAILESGHGTSKLSSKYNNFFGIKASSEWISSGGKTVDMDTREERADGSSYYITATWCVFDDFLSCVRYHSKILWNSKSDSGYRYRAMIGNTNYRECAEILKNGGYATDGSYVTKICNLIEDYNLTQYDTVTWSGETPDYASSDYDASSYSATNSTTSGMSEKDRETFYNFFHAMDNPFDGEKSVTKYDKVLSKEEVDDMLRLANTFSFKTSITTEDKKTHDELNKMSLYATDRDIETTTSSYNTGNKLVDVAMGEVGTKEVPMGSNKTKYNTWAGLPGAAWCDIFVCWCADQLGYLNVIIPQKYACSDTKDWYEQKNLYHTRESGYEPKIGDLIIFQNNTGICHIGIVCGVYTGKNEVKYIETVEGNSGDQVKLRQKEDGYEMTNTRIHGYCEVPYTD